LARGFALLLGAGLLLALSAPSFALLSADRQGELVNLIRQDCGACHGLTLKGGLGPALLPAAVAEQPSDALAQVILDGKPGTPMPPWRGLLSEDEVLWIVETLKEGLPR
jgi:cytochrome c55X